MYVSKEDEHTTVLQVKPTTLNMALIPSHSQCREKAENEKATGEAARGKPGRSCHGRGRTAPCGISCSQTCSQGSTCPASSHTSDNVYSAHNFIR